MRRGHRSPRHRTDTPGRPQTPPWKGPEEFGGVRTRTTKVSPCRPSSQRPSFRSAEVQTTPSSTSRKVKGRTWTPRRDGPLVETVGNLVVAVESPRLRSATDSSASVPTECEVSLVRRGTPRQVRETRKTTSKGLSCRYRGRRASKKSRGHPSSWGGKGVDPDPSETAHSATVVHPWGTPPLYVPGPATSPDPPPPARDVHRATGRVEV